MLTVLLADSERVRLRIHELWLTHAGHSVTAVTAATTLAAVLRDSARGSMPFGLQLIDPRLLRGTALTAYESSLSASVPGVLWAMRMPAPLPLAAGPRVASYCPRPGGPAAMECLLDYILHAETAAWLDASMVGELLGTTARLSPHAFLARFAEDASALLAALHGARATADRDRWRKTLHALAGCTAAVGALGMHHTLESIGAEPWPLTATGDVDRRLAQALENTLRALRRAAGVYGGVSDA